MSMANLVYIVVAVLLPILPAYLLYRLLPSETQVEGPWQGLRIKLGGAFGGYFLVLLAILAFAKTFPAREVWHVSGQIRLDDGDARVIEDLVELQLIPSATSVLPNGAFDLDVLASPSSSSGLLELPVLVVRYAGYRPEPIRLEEAADLLKSGIRRRIEIRDTVVLRPESDEHSSHE